MRWINDFKRYIDDLRDELKISRKLDALYEKISYTAFFKH